MTEKVSNKNRREIPEAASATSIVLLTLATIACGVGAVIWSFAPLALATLVAGSYVLHLFAVRRAARDAVVAHAAEARRLALVREQEFELQLREVALMEPELEKERARLEQQWQHLKGLVHERESRKKTLKQYEASLESVRAEAATALAAARLEVRTREASENDLRDRIAELQADRSMAVKALRAVIRKRAGTPTRASAASNLESEADGMHEADGVRETAEEKARAVVADAEQTARALVAQAETKLESARAEEHEREQTRRTLATQIEELEAARTEAEEALRNVAARRAELQDNPQGQSAYAEVARIGSANGNDVALAPGIRPKVLDPPRLRAWQFIAYKRDLDRRSD
jgi:chromosome segregation ATPase